MFLGRVRCTYEKFICSVRSRTDLKNDLSNPVINGGLIYDLTFALKTVKRTHDGIQYILRIGRLQEIFFRLHHHLARIPCCLFVCSGQWEWAVEG